MELGPEISIFVLQNSPKCNISQITAHKLPKANVNHILACFCKSCFCIYDPKISIVGPQNTPKCNISPITAQKLPKTDVNHISACFYT